MSDSFDKPTSARLLSEVTRKDHHRSVFGSAAHGYRLNPPIPVSTIEEFEARHRIRLPDDYRCFITEIGNGGAGPYYGLFPFGQLEDGVPWEEGDLVGDVSRPFPHVEAWNLPESFWQQEPDISPETPPEEEERLLKAWDKVEQEHYFNPTIMNGAIPICHLGCGLWQWLVVHGGIPAASPYCRHPVTCRLPVGRSRNLHLDVSPCADGTIPMLQQERLVQMGEWLRVNGEAIYGTRRWIVPSEGPMVESVNRCLDKNWKWIETKKRPMVHYTSKGEAVYAICLAWPGKMLKLERPITTPQTQVRMLGYSKPLNWRAAEKGLIIDVPELSISESPCRTAWVFKLTGLKAK